MWTFLFDEADSWESCCGPICLWSQNTLRKVEPLASQSVCLARVGWVAGWAGGDYCAILCQHVRVVTKINHHQTSSAWTALMPEAHTYTQTPHTHMLSTDTLLHVPFISLSLSLSFILIISVFLYSVERMLMA